MTPQRPLFWGNTVAMGVEAWGLCVQPVGSVGTSRSSGGGERGRAAIEGDSGTPLEGGGHLSILFLLWLLFLVLHLKDLCLLQPCKGNLPCFLPEALVLAFVLKSVMSFELLFAYGMS